MVRNYIQRTSSLRLFFTLLPFLALAYQLLSSVVPEIFRVLVPYPLRMVLALL
ncbi:MAG: hypothetical protein JO159_07115 [Acidobacteria bacterium]|nr:hypothetical protein [Acidobacteriota bacterium]MBV9622584.1 hypothetical protein [Acidobacteriota bacterium]